MSLDWSFGDHNARVQEGARNATLVDQNGAWHLRIKYDPAIIAGEHWDVLIAWKRRSLRHSQRLLSNPAIYSSRNGKLKSDKFRV